MKGSLLGQGKKGNKETGKRENKGPGKGGNKDKKGW